MNCQPSWASFGIRMHLKHDNHSGLPDDVTMEFEHIRRAMSGKNQRLSSSTRTLNSKFQEEDGSNRNQSTREAKYSRGEI